MADWLLILPRSRAVAQLPAPEELAGALRSPTARALRRVDVGGATFMTVAESPDDPGVVKVERIAGRPSAVVASALLTERHELATALRSAGAPVSPRDTDGELFAHAVDRWRDDAWARPGGEFSVAAWLPAERTAYLATDGEGARSLFWAANEQLLVASTRLEALVAMPSVSNEADRLGLLSYLALIDQICDSGRTWLRDVEELPPGHALRWRNGTAVRRKWWSFPAGLGTWRPCDEREAIERFRFTLRRSVRERLRGQQRVAITLSGGMNSAAIAAETVALRDREGMDLDLVAVHAEYPGELRSNQAAFAGDVASSLGLPFVPVPIGHAPLWPLPEGMRGWPPHPWLGQLRPFIEAMAEHGSSALTGAGGEIFSRASLTDALERLRIHDILRVRPALKKVGLSFRPWRRSSWRRARRPLAPLARASLPLPAWIDESDAERLGASELRSALAAWTPPDTPVHLGPVHTFLAQLRRMSHMFEYGTNRLPALTPFADRRVVRLAASIDPLPWRVEKYIVRRSLQGVLPPAVLRRVRTPTPWLAKPFFGSPAACDVAKDPLHPVILELIDRREWQSRLSTVTNRVQGRAWLAPLVASRWLREVEGRI